MTVLDGCGKHADRKVFIMWYQKAPRSEVASILLQYRQIQNCSTAEVQEMQENPVALQGSYINVLISTTKEVKMH